MTATTLRFLAIGTLYIVATAHSSAADRKPTTPPTLTVQLVNLAGVTTTELDKAKTEASWIFGKAGVNLNWVHCGSENGDPAAAAPCQDIDDPFVFSMGLVTKSPEFLRDTGFGFAMVYSGQRNHAGVVYPKVAELTKAYPFHASIDQVLAYAMVHEIAHLILGSTAHRPTGIIRAGCRPEELKAVSQRRLQFRSDEVEALHRKLTERSRRLELTGAARIPASKPGTSSRGLY